MGGTGHERIAPLYTESTTYERYERYDPYLRRQVIGAEIPGTRKTTRKKRTVADTWSDIKDSEGYESGHSYSGNFAVKPGFITFGTAAVDKDVLSATETLVRWFDYGRDEDGWNPLVPKTKARCNGTPGEWCDSGFIRESRTAKVEGTDQTVTVRVKVKCPTCKGKGTRPMTPDERAAERARRKNTAKALAVFGEAALRRAAEQYSDKWGDAAAFVGKDHVLFMGVCSS